MTIQERGMTRRPQSLWSRFLCWFGAHGERDLDHRDGCVSELAPTGAIDTPCDCAPRVTCRECGRQTNPVETYP